MTTVAPWRSLPPSPPTDELDSEPLMPEAGSEADPAHEAPRDRRRRWPAVLMIIALILAGAIGRLTAGSDPAATAAPPATSTPSTSGSNESGANEPVADVATSLAPSVVAIEAANSQGSGVVVAPDGLVLTASHVVDGHEQVNVRFADGTTYDGRVVVDRPDLDLAVIRIDADDLDYAELSDDAVAVGQLAIAIGSPFGLDQTISSGVVSALDRTLTAPWGTLEGLIQTDAPINSGSSGGPLANRAGKVIGINVAIASRSGGNDGVGFAVPVDQIREILNDEGNGASVRPDRGRAGSNEFDGRDTFGNLGPFDPDFGLPRFGEFDSPFGTERIELPVFGWLPPGWSNSGSRSEMSLSGSDWSRLVRMWATGPEGRIELGTQSEEPAELADRAEANDGRLITVRGSDGWIWQDDERRTVAWVEGDDVVVTLRAPVSVSADDLQRIADEIDGDLT